SRNKNAIAPDDRTRVGEAGNFGLPEDILALCRVPGHGCLAVTYAGSVRPAKGRPILRKGARYGKPQDPARHFVAAFLSTVGLSSPRFMVNEPTLPASRLKVSLSIVMTGC